MTKETKRKFDVSDETINILDDHIIPDFKLLQEERKRLQNWIDHSFELILNQINNPDETMKLVGLAQFELMVQFCITFNTNTKYYGTREYKRAFNLAPMMRHIFGHFQVNGSLGRFFSLSKFGSFFVQKIKMFFYLLLVPLIFLPNHTIIITTTAQTINKLTPPISSWKYWIRPNTNAREPNTFDPNNCLRLPCPSSRVKKYPMKSHKAIKPNSHDGISIVKSNTNHVNTLKVILSLPTYHFSTNNPCPIVIPAISNSPSSGVSIGIV